MAVGVRLTGASGEYMTTPHNAAFNVSSFEIVARVSADDWTPTSPATSLYILAKYPGWGCRIETSGVLQLFLSQSGDQIYSSTVATGFTDGTTHWLRYTFDHTTGDVNFYTADDAESEPLVWNQLGSTVSGTAAAPDASTQMLYLGSITSSSSSRWVGAIHEVILRDAVSGGNVITEFSAPHTGTRYRDSTGKTWTLNGSAYSTVITTP